MSRPEIRFHQGDLPNLDHYQVDAVAIDTETLGLNPHRDRLCVVQLSPGDGTADVVQILKGQTSAPNIEKLLADPAITKLFHFGRFDIAVLAHAFGIWAEPVFCSKIASKLVRTYTDRHGLEGAVWRTDRRRHLQGTAELGLGAETLSQDQLDYAASDVLYLHRLREVLEGRLAREERVEVAEACFRFLPTRARLDLMGWEEQDIFAHS